MEQNPNLYEIEVSEVQGFEPGEEYKVREAFEILSKLGIAELLSPDKIKLKSDVIDEIIRPIAPYLAKEIDFHDIDIEASTYPYKVISGISSLCVMQKINRLPNSFTIMAGLISPTAYVKRGGEIAYKTTIELSEWNLVKNQMSKLRQLREKFEIEYFKAIGFLHENNIIVRTYPSIEIPGSLVNMVIVPTYKKYYLSRVRVRVSRKG
jgi:hypothetical protein